MREKFQYYVENNHEVIIDPAVFDMVQRELESRQAGKNRHSGTHIFAERLNVANVEAGTVQKYGTQIANTAVPFGNATINLRTMKSVKLLISMKISSKRFL